MFIYSVRSSTLKFASVMALGVILVTALVIFLPSGLPEQQAMSSEVSYDRVDSPEDMARFLAQFGWKVETPLFSDREVTLPTQFEGVFAGYNELQKKQGLDLSAFAGKKLRKAVLYVTPEKGGERYLATLFIYRSCVVGGDVAQTDPNGGVYGFDFKKG